MGFPINSYKLFEAIANNEGQLIKKHFHVDFKLFAILLHDPKANPDFDREVGRSFFDWHSRSGEDFLFTALADPPQSWIRWASEKKGKDFGSNSSLDEIINPGKIFQTFDPSLTALFIAEYLEIPFQKLPVIIFTPDLNLPYFYWMPTNVMAVHDQLDWLKTIPNQFELPWIRGINHAIKVRKINTISRFSSKLVDLSQKISDLAPETRTYAFANPIKPKPIDKKQKDRDIELNLFFSGIELLKRKAEEYIDVDYSAFDKPRFMIVKDNDSSKSAANNLEENKSLISSLFRFSPRNKEIETKSFKKLVEENLEFLQRESKLFLEQGIKMAQSLSSHQIYDYSPLILPFAKSFEKELSYSIVHWVRKKYDISLPQYFYEYQPGKNAHVKLGRNYAIDFNQSRNDLWTSPTLGGQISGFKATVSNLKEHPFKSDLDYQEFLNLAYQIKNIRNRACHSEKTTILDLEKMVDCWRGLFRKNYFETLGALKKEYKGKEI